MAPGHLPTMQDSDHKKIKVLEKHLQKHAEDLLQLDGWRIIRVEQNYSEKKRKIVGEAGAPDGLYIRYGFPNNTYFATALVLWIEWKSPKGKPSTSQKLWHEIERKRGALTLIAGIDFPATVEGFQTWYENSGLRRRKI